MATHELKTVNPFFQDVWNGAKTFEIRKNDRDFKVGDKLILKEFDPVTNSYSDHVVIAIIRHIVTHEQFPDRLTPGYVAMSIEPYQLRDKHFVMPVKSKNR